MSRTSRSRGSSDHGLRPVTKVELSEKHIKLRIIVVIIALVVGAVFIALGVRACVSAEKGWQQITASDSSSSAAGGFTFMYNVGQGGMDATIERRSVTSVYTDAAAKAYRMFDNYSEGGGMSNINSNVGTPVEVSAELYDALAKMVEKGGRLLYYAPFFEIYERLFSCEFDYEAKMYDPNKNSDVSSFFGKISQYANDPDAISLELLDGNKVILHVSDEYAAFAKENDIDHLVGFSWLEGAFSGDYIAQKLKEAGFTYGYIVGKDGTYINLDDSGNSYSYSLYGGSGFDVYNIGRVSFSGAVSGVSLRSFIFAGDELFYIYENGETVTPYIDANGYNLAAANSMVVYSHDGSCADSALAAAKIYISEKIDKDLVSSFKEEGIFTVYYDGGTIYKNDDINVFDVLSIGGKALPVEKF